MKRFQGKSNRFNGQKSKKNVTTVLPLALGVELETHKNEADSRFDVRFKKAANRKDLRKEKRVGKKRQRQEHHAKRSVKEEEKVSKQVTSKVGPTLQDQVKVKTFGIKKKVKKEEDSEAYARQLKKLQENNPQLFQALADSRLISKSAIRSSGLSIEGKDGDDQQIDVLAKKLKLKKNKINDSFKRDGLDCK
jgi:hypothetical protein